MTVTELIAKLQNLPADSQVVMSKDAEGNDFSPLEECIVGHYEPYTTWSGEFTEVPNGGAVALWPVN
jgi:hypothetical protein